MYATRSRRRWSAGSYSRLRVQVDLAPQNAIGQGTDLAVVRTAFTVRTLFPVVPSYYRQRWGRAFALAWSSGNSMFGSGDVPLSCPRLRIHASSWPGTPNTPYLVVCVRVVRIFLSFPWNKPETAFKRLESPIYLAGFSGWESEESSLRSRSFSIALSWEKRRATEMPESSMV